MPTVKGVCDSCGTGLEFEVDGFAERDCPECGKEQHVWTDPAKVTTAELSDEKRERLEDLQSLDEIMQDS